MSFVSQVETLARRRSPGSPRRRPSPARNAEERPPGGRKPGAGARKRIVWIDTHDDFRILDQDPDAPVEYRMTLAVSIETTAQLYDPDHEIPMPPGWPDDDADADAEAEDRLIARALYDLAARIRASGCKTARAWLRRHPLG